MSHKYFKPVKKYVSRALAVKKLKLTPRQFDRMVVLCAIYPIQAPERNCLDKVEGWYYTIEDIKKIYYSNAYDVLFRNQKYEAKRERCIEFNRTDRLDLYREEEYGLVELVKTRYSCFGESLADLGNSLRMLYFVRMLGVDDVADTLAEFEEYLLGRRLLESAFLSRRGVYFSFRVENVAVVWSVPYPAQDFGALIEVKQDLEKTLKFSSVDFLDFDSSSDGSVEEEIIDPNDPERLDVSLLKYAAPVLSTHARLVVHKLKLLYGAQCAQRGGLFDGKKVHVAIKSIPREIEFVLKSEGADLVDPCDAEIVIAESVDQLVDGVQYLQAQFVFDSLNSKKLLDPKLYTVGKELPAHKSPFPDVLEALDSRVLKTLSNTKKYKILDRVVEFN
ncbi:pescadillo [Pancytospora philotis]|nr:pescadillo [Pancytospora philotis]